MSQIASKTDRFERSEVLKAPVARVWKALADAHEFGAWFGVKLNAPFIAGTKVSGPITDPPGYEYLIADLWIEQLEPEKRLAFRWHPFAIEKGVDYSHEPTTLVELELEAVPGGTRLTIRESGFDQLPPARRAAAFKANHSGWDEQLQRIAKYVA